MASTPPSRGAMKNGCLTGLPSRAQPSVGYHSKKESRRASGTADAERPLERGLLRRGLDSAR